jgi:thiamine biosynthesis lipoprotein
MSRPYALREFRAMASPCRIVADDERLVAAGCEMVDALERRWSRFRADSEVSGLNRATGSLCVVSDTTFDLVARAQLARDRTHGWFNPLVLDRLEALGYGGDPSSGAVAPTRVSQEPIELVPEVRGVRLPPGARFDPGGIGKGFAADLVAEHLVALGATTVQVELGGDVRLVGENWTGGVWHVRIQSPLDRTQTIGHAAVADGAIATSAVVGNRWRVGGREVHHLIDPFTGEPCATDVFAATAISSELWWAEIVAKVVVLRGSAASASVFEDLGAAGSIVRSDGAFVVVREQQPNEQQPKGSPS